MNNNKQSSIEWYASKVEDYLKETYGIAITDMNLLAEAKAMHREEHGKTWDESMDNFIARGENYVRAYVDFEDYYAETFGGNSEN